MFSIAHRFSRRTLFWSRFAGALMLIVLTALSAGFVFILQTKELTYTQPEVTNQAPDPFPVGVDPTTKTISEQPDVLTYFNAHFHADRTAPIYISWYDKFTAALAMLDWYQTLASPESRILIIFPGQRREQVAHNIGTILHWSPTDIATFDHLMASSSVAATEGTLFPGKYVVGSDATPQSVAATLHERFVSEVLTRYSTTVAAKVPLHEALVVASMLERETNSFTDMRAISGIIWNRLFISMRLQIDATVQYAKGNQPDQPWWPPVTPHDLSIESPFNTYTHNGLPPEPIAEPSAAAIIAALNPIKTDCYYYFHDPHGKFYCSATYAEHVALLKQVYGQGK